MRNIWGYDPEGKPRLYALNIPLDEIDTFIHAAESQGWTGIVIALPSRQSDETEEERGKKKEQKN